MTPIDWRRESLLAAAVGLPFAEVFSRRCFELIDKGADKRSTITHLLHRLAKEKKIRMDGLNRIADAIVRREGFASTALGRGFAIPHLRTPDVARFVGAIGYSPAGIDFGSLDRTPTKLVLLVLSPHDSRAQHAELLGCLVNLLRCKTLEFALSQSASPAAIYQRLRELDGGPADSRSG
jgi:mannitol/fructose-specific phosphotransferase system IIA component (Ntr-type)